MKLEVIFFLLSVTLFQGVSGVAPGDEDDLCPQESITNAIVLLDSYNYINLLGEGVFPPPVWETLSYQSGDDGWTVNRTGGICRHSLQVCDYENGPGVENWLFTQFIEYLDAKEVFVEVSYDLSACYNSYYCSEEYGDMYYYATNRSWPKEHTDSAKYHHIGTFYWSSSTYTTILIRSSSDEGFYLGFRDNGTCGTINRVRVYYKVCPSKVDGLTHYPALPLPAQNSQEPNVAYAYCSYNSYNSVASGYKAHSDGRCEYGARCECRAGYEEVTTGTAAICRACQRGQYRSSSHNNCRYCPSNTVSSGIAVAMCPCLAGYYRTTYEGPDNACTSPPSSCRNLMISSNSLTFNQVTVTWSRPSVTGRSDFYYNIYYSSSEDDGKFTQHNTQRYIVSSSQVSYTVSGLSPFTSYTIRVTVGNGVSDQDPTGKDNRLCEVSATTLPNTVAQLDILSGLALWNSTDGSSQYEIRYNKTDGQNYGSSSPLQVNYINDETAYYTIETRSKSENEWSAPITVQFREPVPAPQPTCSSTEQFGYSSGSYFEDPCGAAITRIVIYQSSSRVYSIQATYRFENGTTYTAPRHGGTSGSRTTINLSTGEEIVAISGGWYTSTRLSQFKLITIRSNGADYRVHGPYGTFTARYHNFGVKNANIVSFFGRASSSYIYSLGFKYRPN